MKQGGPGGIQWERRLTEDKAKISRLGCMGAHLKVQERVNPKAGLTEAL